MAACVGNSAVHDGSGGDTLKYSDCSDEQYLFRSQENSQTTIWRGSNAYYNETRTQQVPEICKLSSFPLIAGQL